MTGTVLTRVGARRRIVVDNDWAGDPDGLVALAHHLLSPGNRVDAVTSSLLNPMLDPVPTSSARGADLARELVALLGTDVAVTAGAETVFDGGDRVNPAAAAIIAAAEADDELPLSVVCAGPLTNIADALRAAPHIADRFTLVWVGGALEADVFEYNRDTDAEAARAVLGHPGLAVVQIPMETYRTVHCTVAEIDADLAGTGAVGAWLAERFAVLPLPEGLSIGEIWAWGDSVPVAITAYESATCAFADGAEPGHTVCTAVDGRVLVADLLAKLRRHAAA